MTNIIIDCDPGIDDALALLFAFASKELNILAVTCVAGNRPVVTTFNNAQRLLALADAQHIPVFQGASTPISYSAPRCNLVHGEDGLGGVDLSAFEIDAKNSSLPAHQAIREILIKEPIHTITIVAIGPLTNLALLLLSDPDTFSRIKNLAVMGGAVDVPGNVTPVAEFNFWADPIAAERVLNSGITIDLFPLDVTSKAICTKQWLDLVKDIPGKCAGALNAMIAAYFLEDPLLHDPCPIAWLLQPDLFISQPAHVKIETAAQWTAGKTIGWSAERSDLPAPPNVNLHTDLNTNALLQLMLDKLKQLP